MNPPPRDPHESYDHGAASGASLGAPTAIFISGPPSPKANRLSDAILDFRPGALVVIARD